MTASPRKPAHPPTRQTHFAADDGVTIPVQVCGDRGRPIILLHEWAGDHSLWRPFVGPLSAAHTVYVWDARGHGFHRPERDCGAPTVERMALDLAQMIDHYKIDRPVVVGHSMGALTLWQYIAMMGADALGAVCFIDQSPRLLTDEDWRLGIYGDFPAARNAGFCHSLRTDFSRTVLELVANGHNERARQQVADNSDGIRRLRERLDNLDAQRLAACWESLAAADLRPALARVTTPTLLIYGGQSNYYSRAVADYVHHAIAGSQLSIFENGDHSPHHSDRSRFICELTSVIDALDHTAAGTRR